jgi:hypothetical protein
MKKGPVPVTRQSGGMRSIGLSGEIDSERLEQQAAQAVAQNKTVQQQGAAAPAKPSAQSQTQHASRPQQPREVGSIKEELVERPAKDVVKGLKTIFDINRLLEINLEKDSPEEVVRKKKLHQRWQQLTKAEQQVAQQKYQQELKKKQEEEKRRQLEKERQEKARQETIAPPAGVDKKPGLFITGKSSKKKAQNRLQQQMKTMGIMGSPN